MAGHLRYVHAPTFGLGFAAELVEPNSDDRARLITAVLEHGISVWKAAAEYRPFPMHLVTRRYAAFVTKRMRALLKWQVRRSGFAFGVPPPYELPAWSLPLDHPDIVGV
jgi:hypothetical protein